MNNNRTTSIEEMRCFPGAGVTAVEFIDEVIAMLSVAGSGLNVQAEFNGMPFEIHGSLRNAALMNLERARQQKHKEKMSDKGSV